MSARNNELILLSDKKKRISDTTFYVPNDDKPSIRVTITQIEDNSMASLRPGPFKTDEAGPYTMQERL